jgi:hypothetical protein
VCAPKIKGLRTLLKLSPTPCKNEAQPTPNNWAQFKSGIVPKINQKMKKKKMEDLKVKWVFRWVGDKIGNLGFWVAGGGWVRWRMAGGDVLVVGEVMGGDGLVDFGFLGRRVTDKGFRGVCTAVWEKWGKRGGGNVT